MSLDSEIRLAIRSDATEIARLSKIMIEHGLGWSYTPARIQRAIAHKSRNVIVAHRDKTLAGFGMMTYKRDSANLDLLGVTDNYRRQGIGKSLVHWLEKTALTAGIVENHIQVRKTNRSAINFYSRLGYDVVKEIAGYYAGAEAAVVMSKRTNSNSNSPDVDISRILKSRGENDTRY